MKATIALIVPVLLLMSCGDNKEPENALTDTSSLLTQPVNEPAMEPASMNQPKMFYWNYDENKGVETAAFVPQDEALKTMESLPDTDGNFLGLEMAEAEIVQFMYQDGRGLVLDIPNVDEPVDKVITMEQCVKIIKDLYAGKSAGDIAKAY